MEKKREIKSFVIRGGRLSPLQRRGLEEFGPHYIIPYNEKQIDFQEIFGNTNPVILEIGFGMGHATLEIAQRFPDKNFLGIEVHKPGVGKVLHEIGEKGLKNLRLINYDAVKVLLKMIPNESVNGFHIFFPDPWPKKKHHKRRLIQSDFVEILVSKLEKKGYIYAVTDWEEYSHQMLQVLTEHPGLNNRYIDFCDPPIEWRPQTSFERKGKAKDHMINEVWVDKI